MTGTTFTFGTLPSTAATIAAPPASSTYSISYVATQGSFTMTGVAAGTPSVTPTISPAIPSARLTICTTATNGGVGIYTLSSSSSVLCSTTVSSTLLTSTTTTPALATSYALAKCTPCPAGYYSAAGNVGACTQVAAGYYSNAGSSAGATAQVPCLIGTYSPLPGAAQCLVCANAKTIGASVCPATAQASIAGAAAPGDATTPTMVPTVAANAPTNASASASVAAATLAAAVVASVGLLAMGFYSAKGLFQTKKASPSAPVDTQL